MSWNFKEGKINKLLKNDNEYFNCMMHFFNSLLFKTTSYKFGFLKAILDNLFNIDDNYSLSFELLSYSFSRIYWNIIVKYNLPQKYPSKQGDLSSFEVIIKEIIKENELLMGADFDSIKEDIKIKYLKKSFYLAKKDVVGALYSDLDESIYGFDKEKGIIWFSKESYEFLLRYKSSLEKLNYYSWIIWLEKVLSKHELSEGNLGNKLDQSNKRESLLEFKKKLFIDKNNTCFYCNKNVSFDGCEIDHFVPWSFTKDDQIWNLVVSCRLCNGNKKNKLPNKVLLQKIKNRNEKLFSLSYSDELDRLYNSAKFNGLVEWDKYFNEVEDVNEYYYSKNACNYCDETSHVDMHSHYKYFESFINYGDRVLDIGFGSGRDLLYFKDNYDAYGIDLCDEFVQNMKEIGLENVFHTSIFNYSNDLYFDGIWACASLLHCDIHRLREAFQQCYNLLKDDGIMYVSFKYGDNCGINGGRYFVFLSENNIHNYIDGLFSILHCYVNLDSKGTEWINFLLKKTTDTSHKNLKYFFGACITKYEIIGEGREYKIYIPSFSGRQLKKDFKKVIEYESDCFYSEIIFNTLDDNIFDYVSLYYSGAILNNLINELDLNAIMDLVIDVIEKSIIN